MSNIQGRIKYSDLEELFNLGELTNPSVLEDRLAPYVDAYNNKVLEQLSEDSYCECVQYHSIRDLISGIKSGQVDGYDEVLQKWYLIQDVRCILEVRCVARLSQSNNVMADRITLLTIERVLRDKDVYLSL